MQVIKYAFQQHGDERGMLVALEEHVDIPFEIKRVYYMYDTKSGVRRGFHAHKSLKQILVCIHGSCKILLDNGKGEKKVISLEKPYCTYQMKCGGRCMIFQRMQYYLFWPQNCTVRKIILEIIMNFWRLLIKRKDDDDEYTIFLG